MKIDNIAKTSLLPFNNHSYALFYFINIQGGPEIGGIFVKALLPEGVADKDGRVNHGKIIL